MYLKPTCKGCASFHDGECDYHVEYVTPDSEACNKYEDNEWLKKAKAIDLSFLDTPQRK